MVVAQPANHWLFQLANISLLLSYVAPDLLALRVILCVASLCFALWAALVLNFSVDTFVWNACFLIINGFFAARLIYQRRPIKLTEEQEEIYQRLFRPVGVNRLDFKNLISIALLRSLKAGSVYIEEGNETHNLTLVLNGSLVVSKTLSTKEGEKHESVINEINSYEFIESPEWLARLFEEKMENFIKKAKPKPKQRRVSIMDTISRRTRVEVVDPEVGINMDDVRKKNIVGVSVHAQSNCTFFMWPVEQLAAFLQKNPHLYAPFGSLVGADVARRLFRQTKKVNEEGLKSTLKSNTRKLMRGLKVMKTLSTTGLVVEQSDDEEEENDVIFTAIEDQVYDWFTAQLDEKLPRAVFKKLMEFAKFRRIRRKGTVLFREGEEVNQLAFLLSGQFEVVLEGDHEHPEKILPILDKNNFLGALEFVNKGRSRKTVEMDSLEDAAEEAEEPLSQATVRSAHPNCEYLTWDFEELRTFLKNSPKLSPSFQAVLGINIAHWLSDILSKVH